MLSFLEFERLFKPVQLAIYDRTSDRRLHKQRQHIHHRELQLANVNIFVSQKSLPQQARQTPRESVAEGAQIAPHGRRVDGGRHDLRVRISGLSARERGVAQDLDEDDGGADVCAGKGAEEGGGNEAEEEDGGERGGAGFAEALGEDGDPASSCEATDEDEFADGEGEEGDWEASDGQSCAGKASAEGSEEGEQGRRLGFHRRWDIFVSEGRR